MDAILQNRFEGSIFFVYDRHLLQKEEDLLEDAIIYFYPHTMPLDNQCRLCGQLMGVVQFADAMLDSYPVLFRFKNEKIAVKHVGKYSFALAGSSVEPDSALLATVDRLYFLFSFYHGSIDQVELECEYKREKFLVEIHVIWEQYLAFIRNYGNNLPSVFNPIPYLPLKKDPNHYFLKASHILESCQRRPQIIAGAILYNRYILCSQLTDSISRCLLLLKPNQQNHPALPIETDYQLPFGVRLFNVYLNRKNLKQILEDIDNSPYQSQSSDTSSLLRCCCNGRSQKTPRQTPRQTPIIAHRQTSTVQPYRRSPKQEAIIDKDDEVLTQSEKDPLSSSTNSGSKLCKAMLEDLLLKGFRCCKCIDEEEGELEDGNSFDKSIESVIEVKEEKFKPKNGFMFSTEDINPVQDDLQENEIIEIGMHSRIFEHSQNSHGTLETESGIEVTGSDFHSSAATHFDQRCASYTPLSYQEKSLNFRVHSDSREQCNLNCKTDQVSKDKKSYSEKSKNFGLQERDDSDELGKEKERIHSHSMSNENVDITSGDLDKITRKQQNEESFYVNNETIGETSVEAVIEKRPKQLNEKCDNMLNNVNAGVKEEALEKMADDKLHSSLNGVTEPIAERNCTGYETVSDDILNENVHQIFDSTLDRERTQEKDISHKMSQQSFGVASEDEQYQLSSSEDSYKTSDEILDTEERGDSCELNGIHYGSQVYDEINGDQPWLINDLQNEDTLLDETRTDVVHVCKLEKIPDDENRSLGSREKRNDASQVKCNKAKSKNDSKQRRNCCEVDGLIHANLFVQAHSEIVLILLAKCDLYQNEDAVKSLWNTALSQLGELDISMKNCAKENYQGSQVPFNLLIYDNFEKKMSGNPVEPVYAQDHVFCDTAKILHNQFNNTSQLCDVTLRSFINGIYAERTLSREAYFQENVTSSSDRNLTQNISGCLAQKMRECIVNHHGLPFV